MGCALLGQVDTIQEKAWCFYEALQPDWSKTTISFRFLKFKIRSWTAEGVRAPGWESLVYPNPTTIKTGSCTLSLNKVSTFLYRRLYVLRLVKTETAPSGIGKKKAAGESDANNKGSHLTSAFYVLSIVPSSSHGLFHLILTTRSKAHILSASFYRWWHWGLETLSDLHGGHTATEWRPELEPSEGATPEPMIHAASKIKETGAA